MYLIIGWVVGLTCGAMVAKCMAPRAIKCFEAFASAEKFDALDESILLEGLTNTGNHPAGVAVDAAIYWVVSAGCGLVWPITVPAGVVFYVAWKRRQEALVVQTLKGEE